MTARPLTFCPVPLSLFLHSKPCHADGPFSKSNIKSNGCQITTTQPRQPLGQYFSFIHSFRFSLCFIWELRCNIYGIVITKNKNNNNTTMKTKPFTNREFGPTRSWLHCIGGDLPNHSHKKTGVNI